MLIKNSHLFSKYHGRSSSFKFNFNHLVLNEKFIRWTKSTHLFFFDRSDKCMMSSGNISKLNCHRRENLTGRKIHLTVEEGQIEKLNFESSWEGVGMSRTMIRNCLPVCRKGGGAAMFSLGLAYVRRSITVSAFARAAKASSRR